MVEVNSVVTSVVVGSSDTPELAEDAGDDGILWIVDVWVTLGDRLESKPEDDEEEVPPVALESVQLVEKPLAVVTGGWEMDELSDEAADVFAKDDVVLEPWEVPVTCEADDGVVFEPSVSPSPTCDVGVVEAVVLGLRLVEEGTE